MDDTPAPIESPRAGPPPRRWKGLALVILIAFIGGLVAMTWISRNLALPSWLGGTPEEKAVVTAAPSPAPTALPVIQPVVAAPANEQIGAIEQRIAQASAAAEDAAGNATNAEDLLVAFAVRRTIDRGDQLGYLEPQLLKRFAGQPNAVNTIIAGARTPVTMATLRLGFDQVRPTLVSSDEGWIAALAAEVTSFFSIRDRRAPSNAPSARHERARQLLLGGQVEAALAEVRAMPQTEESASWIAKAKIYVDVHRALDVIEAQVLQPVATQPPPAR